MERIGFGKRLLDKFCYLFVELVAVPLTHVGGHLINRIVAVAPARITIAVTLIHQRLKIV